MGWTGDGWRFGVGSCRRVTPFQGMQVNESIREPAAQAVAPRLLCLATFWKRQDCVRGGVGIFTTGSTIDQVGKSPITVTRTAFNTTIADHIGEPGSGESGGVTSIQGTPAADGRSNHARDPANRFVTVLDGACGLTWAHLLQRRSPNVRRVRDHRRHDRFDIAAGQLPRPPGYADIQRWRGRRTTTDADEQAALKAEVRGVGVIVTKAMTIVNGNNDAVNPYSITGMRNYGGRHRTHNCVQLPTIFRTRRRRGRTWWKLFDNWYCRVTSFTRRAAGIGWVLAGEA